MSTKFYETITMDDVVEWASGRELLFFTQVLNGDISLGDVRKNIEEFKENGYRPILFIKDST